MDVERSGRIEERRRCEGLLGESSSVVWVIRCHF